MAGQYSMEVLKIVVAQICQTIGWHSIQSTPLDIMVDILHRYIMELGSRSHNYAEHFGHTTPNLDEIGLAFRDAGIRVEDLSEYIQNVESVPFPHEVPKYPIPGESHLNFLKPGSREVLTRPVHVHEHLPPMYPDMAEEDNQQTGPLLSVDTVTASGVGATSPSSPKGGTFKRPGEPLEHHSAKRARLMLEEEGRPLREISSVMMTTSGFLSPAREGKLPEARTPTQPTDSLSRSSSPIGSPSSYPTVPPEVKGDKKGKKVVPKKVMDGIKKLEKDDKEIKKKESKVKEVGKVEKVVSSDDTKVKKLVSMKEFAKLKALKSGAMKLMAQAGFTPGPSISGLGKIPKINKLTGNKSPKGAKSIVKIPKIEKQHSGNVPAPQPKLSPIDKSKEGIIIDGKLSSEPDKQKLNIFKKLSKVKEEKTERTDAFESAPKDSRESSPGLIIDESESSIRRDTRMAQIDTCIDSVIQQSVNDFGDEDDVKPSALSQVVTLQDSSIDCETSPPLSPSAPKTPELPSFTRKGDKLSEQKERKRKRERSKSKKDKIKVMSPKKIKVDISDESEVFSEKPRTPEVHEVRPPVFPFFTHYPPAPGLIPPPIGNPFYPRPLFPLTLSKNMPHPAMPNMPMPPPLFMHHRPDELPEALPKQVIIEKPPQPIQPPPVAAVLPPPLPPPPPPPPPPQLPVLPIKIEVEKSLPPVLQSVSPPKEKILHPEKRQREHKKEKKEKDKTKKKKEKKEKLKGKERAEKKKIKEEKREKVKTKEKKEKKEKRKEKERDDKPEGSVPRITLRLGPSSPRPPTPDAMPPRKITIKPVVKVQEDSCDRFSESLSSKREPSPELARMSALITRPPKKPSSKGPRSDHPSELFTLQSIITPPLHSPSPTTAFTTISTTTATTTTTTTTTTMETTIPILPKVLKTPVKPFAKVKTKASPPSNTSKEDTKELLPFYHDNSGNKVWICPGCGGQDDGSPMIGCDDCDAWYHWVCVGIQVPPDLNEDWYCRVCIVKKQGHMSDKSKKRRKKKLLTQ